MGDTSTAIVTWLTHQDAWAPLIFIAIHLLRPFLFIPVMLVCITGGVVFGPIAGSAYSIIGTMLSSLVFYKMIRLLPSGFTRLQSMQKRLLKRHSALTVKQVAILRLIPFIHFHLLSFCLIQISTDFKDYTKSSLMANFPLAVIYTSMGQWLTLLSIPMMLLFSGGLALLCFFARRKYEVLVWNDFFQAS
ncbi:VTT domain-containing protein [Halobacillus salinarum]|uniref:TVP38/TMEM64 family membrane protein n=1 Tax=Halobacillus salinarum TaxID=2932257 RepID=A0ABY4EQD1_9BACI|nr:VTT domain-containing protein [Halobacillus salinarum]UOQ46190.1 VTT domain-containing protein [Halobacillus salinarum]